MKKKMKEEIEKIRNILWNIYNKAEYIAYFLAEYIGV